MAEARLYGLLAEFANPADLFHACEKVRDGGFHLWDSHSPFPVHGIEEAMGLNWSKVPWFSLVFGLSGAGAGFLLQTWVAVYASPLVISGKPLWSWQAFMPVTFELGVLFCAIGTLLGMFALNRLPRLHHPLFSSERFERFSDDAFFISVEARDPRFDVEKTTAFLREIGATHVEIVED